jgi:peptide/nickel transport system substrate-binding protein
VIRISVRPVRLFRHVRRDRLVAIALLAAGLPACSRPAPCGSCDHLVIVATGEPSSILPPLAYETVGRDIGDQVYERLAELQPGHAPSDTTGYEPRLAARWERVDSLTWRFHVRPGARWSDGQPVTASDVVYSFATAADTTLVNSPPSALAGHVTVTPDDSTTVKIRFDRPYPEQLYDATWHVRVIPRHIWQGVPSGQWASDTSIARLVGSGPYRVTRWVRGESLDLEAVPGALRRPGIRQVTWRFAADPDAALTLVLSGEGDMLETLTTPEGISRVEADSSLRVVSYPSAVYGFVGYRIGGAARSAPSVFSDVRIRRALNMAINRQEMAERLFGSGAKAPPGPFSQVLWLWNDSIRVLPFDTAAAAAALDAAGWRVGVGGVRRLNARRLTFDILVPSSSPVRRRAAEILQERWRQLGAEVTVTAVEFPVFQERLANGKFDAYVAGYLDAPSPRDLSEQWTAAGIGELNYGGYSSPAFDSAFAAANREADPARALVLWRAAFDTLNADAPALFLFSPVNRAAVARRLGAISINPWSWLSNLPEWKIGTAR